MIHNMYIYVQYLQRERERAIVLEVRQKRFNSYTFTIVEA